MRSVLLVALAVGCFCSTVGDAQPARQNRPNVVLIITDDMGWADLGSYGATDIRTPNLDRLASEGIRLTDFYSNGTTCSPTRAGLISGRYQQRFGIEAPLSNSARAGDSGLPATGYSLPQLLKNHGYATGLVGKWHLGYVAEKSPRAHGFDYFFGLKSGYHDYYTHHDGEGRPDLWENDKPIEIEGYTTDIVTERAARFIGLQGRHVGRPGRVDVEVELAADGRAVAATISGKAVVVFETVLTLA